jgi:cyclopropane-fatty-acyl-phospholipid synthase
MSGVALQVAHAVESALGERLPIGIRAWDGSEICNDGQPLLNFRSPEAIRHIAWAPGELGLARAYVSGALDLEGDVFDFFDRAADAWGSDRHIPTATKFTLLRTAAAIGVWGGRPPVPAEEATPNGHRLRHSLRADRQAIAHHYDVGNDFYQLVLGPSMVYSCAYFAPHLDDSGTSTQSYNTLEQAQEAKLDIVARKLGLQPGMRLLDVGCGWGSMARHAALHYDVEVVGITLSHEQAALARRRIDEAGLTDRVEIRLQDYREIKDGPYDAISSIGMAEHVGRDQFAYYSTVLYGLLRMGGRLLNHQIARRPGDPQLGGSPFIQRYVFPDGELLPLADTVASLEGAGFEVRDVESLREHYALTLRQWVANLQNHWDECVDLVGQGRARVWQAYMAASAIAFERNRIGVNQIVAVRPTPSGVSAMPLRSRQWL